MGKSLNSNLMDNWVLSPGAGGLAYQGGNGDWFYGGGGGGVLVDGKVNASNPLDIITFLHLSLIGKFCVLFQIFRDQKVFNPVLAVDMELEQVENMEPWCCQE